MVVVPVQWAENDEQYIQAKRLSCYHSIAIATSVSAIESHLLAQLAGHQVTVVSEPLKMHGSEVIKRTIIQELQLTEK